MVHGSIVMLKTRIIQLGPISGHAGFPIAGRKSGRWQCSTSLQGRQLLSSRTAGGARLPSYEVAKPDTRSSGHLWIYSAYNTPEIIQPLLCQSRELGGRLFFLLPFIFTHICVIWHRSGWALRSLKWVPPKWLWRTSRCCFKGHWMNWMRD